MEHRLLYDRSLIGIIFLTCSTMSFATLDETNFPLYAVNVLDKNIFVIGGGGGSAKTGVPNAMNLYQLSCDGRKLKATLAHKFDTGRQAVMNCAVHPVDKKVLAVGMDNKCQILELDVKEEIVENSNEKKGIKGKFVATKKRTFQFKAKSCATTVDSSLSKTDDDCGFQKVVKFTANGEYIITGGSDGHVKILKYPSLECLHDVLAHRTDVDDLDVHPNGKKFVTVSRDTTAYVWRVDGGKKDFQLYFTADREEGFFRVRACRFGTTENGDVRLFTIHVPSKFNRRLPTPCYLVKWDTKKWVPELSQAAGIEPLTQMAISQNGVYVAVGTSEGGVSLYVSWSLMPITQVKEVHTIFVTGLAFLPPSKLVNEDLNNEAAVLSISADDTVKVTTVGKRGEYSIWYVIVGFLILLYLTFMALAYLGVDV